MIELMVGIIEHGRFAFFNGYTTPTAVGNVDTSKTYIYNLVERDHSNSGRQRIDVYLNGDKTVNNAEGRYGSSRNYVSIGSLNGSRSEPWDGLIKEIMIFNRQLPEAARQEITFYLSRKWGLMTQIDSDDDGTKDNADGDIGGVAFNKPPSFTSTPPSQAFENTEYSYFVTAHDAEGDSFTLEVVQPSGATMVGASNNSGDICLDTWSE